jgi:hypothetical protein
MLPIDLVKSGKALNKSFEKAQIDMEGFIHDLVGGYLQKSGIKTFEIQYRDDHLSGDEKYKQNGLPASLFVEINWNNNTIRTFFARQPTMGDGLYQSKFYTFSTSVDYGHNGIEHYDYPARKLTKEEAGAFMPTVKIENHTRSHTHEPRHNKDGAFSDWLVHFQYENSILSGSKVYHIDTFFVSNILNWKQGIGWMEL